MTSLRAGLSGCSATGAALLAAARTHQHCAVVAVHDADAAHAAAFGGEHGVGFCTGSFDALLGSGIDFVVLAGDLAARPEQVAAAAAQGVHCLVLAPFATDVAAARAMTELCAKAQVRLGVLVPEFADPLWEQLRRMVAADWLGAVVAVQGLLGVDDGLRGLPAPLPPFVALASRHLHLASWMVGRPALRVTAQAVRMFGGSGGGGVATAVLRGDVACTFTCSRATAVSSFAVHGTDGGCRVIDDRIGLRGRAPFEGAVFDYDAPGTDVWLSRSDLHAAIAAEVPRCELLGRFARWIDDCDDFPCPADQALDDLRVVDAMQRAAQSGRVEDV